MTLRETIAQEFLDTVENPAGLEGIFQRYNRSKGPLYLGLADAFAELLDNFETLTQETKDSASHKDFLSEQVDTLHDEEIELQELVQNLAGQVQMAQQALDEAHGSLDRLDQLEQAGFGGREFDRLSELLRQISAEQGAPPEAGVSEFFTLVERFDQVLSLDLEATRAESRAEQAKAEAQRWQADADARQVQSMARISVIDLVDGLLDRGVKGDDFTDWSSIIDTAGVTVEELAGSLEVYSDIQSLSDDLRAQADVLQTEVSGLKAQVNALGQERDNAHEAIVAVKEKALKEVESAEKQARKHMDTLFHDAIAYGDLKKEAADLGELINSARDLRSGDLEKWRHLPREVIQHTLTGAIRWTEGDDGRNIPVPAPGVVTQTNSLLSYSRLNLRQILIWALSGVLSDGHQGAPIANR